jgi:ribosomal protein S18 acetylase RimI-like enzyme
MNTILSQKITLEIFKELQQAFGEHESLEFYQNMDCYVYIVDTIQVGYVFVKSLTSVDWSKWAELYSLYIKSEFRRQSYAKTLMHYVLSALHQYYCIQTYVKHGNIASLNLCFHLGFKIAENITANDGSEMYIMRKYNR